MSYKQVCAFCFHRTIQEKLKSIFLNQSKFAANKLSAINLSFGLGFFLLETYVCIPDLNGGGNKPGLFGDRWNRYRFDG